MQCDLRIGPAKEDSPPDGLAFGRASAKLAGAGFLALVAIPGGFLDFMAVEHSAGQNTDE